MSAFLFEGPIGGGKSYAATTMVHWLLLRGRRVAVNWDLVVPGEYRYLVTRYEGLDELFGLEDIDIFCDEAQSSAGSRDWEAMPKKVRNWLSHHRHYGNNLLFFTQHYKFVDVYIRRLAPTGVWSVWRFLNLTGATPRPEANPEDGNLNAPKISGSRLFIRPWKDLDHPYPIGGFLDLIGLSRQTPELYKTRDKSTSQDLHEKKKSASVGPPAAAPPSASTAQLPI